MDFGIFTFGHFVNLTCNSFNLEFEFSEPKLHAACPCTYAPMRRGALLAPRPEQRCTARTPAPSATPLCPAPCAALLANADVPKANPVPAAASGTVKYDKRGVMPSRYRLGLGSELWLELEQERPG